MTNNFKLIKDAIKAKLLTLTKLKFVYAYEKGDLSGFPSVSIYSAEYNPVQTTTQHDKDEYNFVIHLYQEMTGNGTNGKTPAQAEDIVDEAMVDIIQAFQLDPQLGGLCDNLTISAVKGWVDREVIDRACVFTIKAEKIVEV